MTATLPDTTPDRPVTRITSRDLGDMQAILDEWFGETEGEVTPELEALDALFAEQRDAKLERWAYHIIDAEAELGALDREIARLTERRARREKAIERSRAQLRFTMHRLGVERVDTATVTLAVQHNPPKVVGEVDPDTLKAWAADAARTAFVRHTPEQTVTVPEKWELDRKAVADAWKAAAITGKGKAKQVDEEAGQRVVPPGLSVVRDTKLVIK